MLYCKKSATGIVAKSRYRGRLSRSPLLHFVHRGLRRGVAVLCRPHSATAAHTSCPSRDRDIARHRPLSLAGSERWEEDRSTSIKIKSGRRHMQSKAQIDQILRQKCEAREIPGVVAMAATGSEVIYQGAFGKRDLSRDDPMTADSVFWIASMTKAITTAAGMQLVEQGKLSLDEPIGKVLPDLASPQVLEGFDASGAPKLRPAKGQITLRQLMTHTAGFVYELWSGDKATYLEKTGTPGITTCQNAALKTPLAHDPGTRWDYGTNIDFVGKAVEAVSGQRLDAYLRDHLLAPLGMNDTAFKISDSMRTRLVGMHARAPEGLAPIPFELEQNPEFHMSGGGLYGTAADYIKFTQMILNKGKGNGNQVLKPETVALMGQNNIGALEVGKLTTAAPIYTNDVDLYPGMVKKWGLSFLINTAKTPE